MIWLHGTIRRAGRFGATAAGVAIAVALLASIGAFLARSKATMTSRAAQNVAVDWQVEVQSGADLQAVLDAVRPRARVVLPVGFAQTSGLRATTGGSTQTTGPGAVLGIPDGYRQAFPNTIRDLAGGGTGVLVAQQTAANLRVAPGDTIVIGRAGLAPVHVRVDGVVDLPNADSLFQKVGAPTGAQPQAPPDNVLLLPERTWHAFFDRVSSTHPELVRTQVHAALGLRLAHDPAAAFTQVTGAAHNLEAQLSGAALVGDNLAAALDAARADALYAQVLFLFLGVPGAVLAALLTGAIAASGATRRRREQGLLRARGATTLNLVRLALAEALLVGGVGAVAGLGVASLVGAIEFGSPWFGATPTSAIGFSLAAAIVGLATAGAAIAVPAWRDARAVTVVGARRAFSSRRAPWWLRFGGDLGLLAISGLVFWLTGRNGYKLVLAPEGTPSISVNYAALAGPALLWIGAGLFVWRCAYMLLGTCRRAAVWLARPFAGSLASTVGASMCRQRRLLASALALVALTMTFAASTAVFNTTYRAQAGVDARLTNGADVTVTQPPGSVSATETEQTIAHVPGVRSVEPLQHRFAYVGADLQDLYGVRTSTIVAATKLQDAYFQGGTARTLIGRLDIQTDGILLSAETVKDFQLTLGDTVRLRLRDARDASLREVPFRYLGVVKEFPTAPRDSFLVANADYIARQTGSTAADTLLIDTGSTAPPTVAARLRAAFGARVTVTDITDTRKVVATSLTAVDLSGLTKVELGFAVVLAAASTGLVFILGFVERRRTFAIVTALGGRSRQLGSFVWSEALFVVAGGLFSGAIAGTALSIMLAKVLAGVFDPPPAVLSVPWAYLGAVAGVAVAAVAVTSTLTIRHARHAPLSTLREL